MIKEFKYIPTTATSRPFGDATELCNFAKIGYVEDEYFQTGTANLYRETEDPNTVEAYYKDAPYTTRIVVRRPVDKAKFSGNIVFEILNSSANYDIDRMWVDSWPFFTRNGDIFVGLSSKGHVVESLKKYDPQRYADINWANPLPDRDYSAVAKSSLRFLPQYEVGLVWDMIVDLAKLLRSDDEMNPVREYGKNWIYLTGWSQSTGYVNRIANCFAYRPENCENGPLFDGFLLGGGGNGMAPIDNMQPRAPRQAGKLTKSSIQGTKDPFMAVNTESETRGSFWFGDFDEPNFKFRTWQIAGSSHDSKYNLFDYFGEKWVKDLADLGYVNGYYGVDGDPMDAPYEPVFSAAWQAMYKWVRDGVPAPHAPKIETEMGDCVLGDPFGSFVQNRTDALGNTLGGIRTPALNYPTGKYSSWSVDKNGKLLGLFGKVNPYSAAFLKEMYGSLENYEKLIQADYTRLVSQGFLLEGDREAFIGHLVKCAKERGLE